MQGGKATEYTYRSSLETLLEALAPDVDASSDPKHIACGAPDFIVERRQIPIGYVETKIVGEDLDKGEKTDQLKRYREALHNLIFTDYLEFRWYVNGQRKLTARLATVGKNHKLAVDADGVATATRLFSEFYQTDVPTVSTPKDLAERMAQLTKLVRNLTFNALQSEDEVGGSLHKQYQAFQDFLLPGLKSGEFADIYAQTMAYGLFAARASALASAPAEAPFSRGSAYQYLFANNFLRKLFLDVGEELDGTLIAPFLDDLAALLAHADMGAILRDFGKRTRTEDPVVHFYETFLAAYDPKLRESRGVFYTPEPAVAFIVNSVDWLLKHRFNRPLGLADKSVYLLDPATGTSTFLYFVVRVIYDTLMTKKQGGAWQDYVHQNLLPRLFGFELLMAPYVIAHLKLGLLLRDLGYQWNTKEDRLRVYLTNALDEGVTHSETLGDLGWYISQEASEAAQVKKNTPIMVVMGNPPYSGHSANASQTAAGEMTFIGKLVRDYYFVDGAPLGERNPKWLQDDYVKFIRFAQWRIQQTGHGMVAFITNHGYLDNPTFRGMRQSLLNTFDEIYVLDLHGNSKKKERAPDGGKDENVFDIQQGVAILLAVKNPSAAQKDKGPAAKVHHAHLWGERASKYAFLGRNSVASTDWTDLEPVTPSYLFVLQNIDIREEYEHGWKVTDAMPINSVGIVTARDDLTIHWTAKEVLQTIKDFSSLPEETARAKYHLGVDAQDWKVSLAQKDILESGLQNSKIVSVLYRPFDIRYTYYTGQSRGFICRPRSEVMPNMLNGENMGLIATRQTRDQWDVFAARYICGHKACAAYDINSLFPLYLYTTPDSTAGNLFAQTETTRTPNLAPEFIKAFSEKLGLAFVSDGTGDLKKTFGPEDIFHYAYAVFHSPTYRSRYAEFLKIDFPRLPLTANKKLFARLAAKGAELVSLHLLKASDLDNFITSYPVAGSNAVEKIRYEKKKVWINAEQYFGGVPEAVWAFHVGGYQVCDKWLKDRKGRTLTHEDLSHYQRVVVALKETLRLMAEIDKAIPAWPLP